jgi:type I restriction enzyme S subunit
MAPVDWREVTLGDIAARHYGLVDGPFGSALPASAYTMAGIPLIRGNNLSLGQERFRFGDFVFVSSETAARHKRSRCVPGDVVFTKKGTIGQTGLVPHNDRYQEFLISGNQMKLTVDRDQADPLFVYYAVSSKAAREKIARDSTVTGVPKTNVAYLRRFPIRLPPLSEQRAIAQLVGTLDDKIELNRRVNETLEATVRAIFSSWFVDFEPTKARIEGRAGTLASDLLRLFPSAWTDDAAEPTPRGWNRGSLGDVASHKRSSVSAAVIEPSTPYIALEHMPRRSIALTEWDGAEGIESNKARFARGDILFGKLRPYFHKVGVAPVDGVCSTDIVVIEPKSPSWFGFVLGVASSDAFVEYTNAGSTGTKMPRTSWDEMARYELTLPDTRTADAFTNLIEPFINRIIAGIHGTRALREIRDALLPPLMSGSLSVKELEGTVEAIS